MDINATLFGQMITFAIFVLFTMRYIWPILEAAMESRKKTISEGLAAAEKGKQTLLDANSQAQEKIKAAREKAAEIIASANNQAESLIAKAKEVAEEEKNKIIVSGNKQVQIEIAKAMHNLQADAAKMVTLGVEKFLIKQIDQDEQINLIDKIVSDFSKQEH